MDLSMQITEIPVFFLEQSFSNVNMQPDSLGHIATLGILLQQLPGEAWGSSRLNKLLDDADGCCWPWTTF